MSTTTDTPAARPVPPSLEYQLPICPLCHERVEHDGDGWLCSRCAAVWSSGPGDEESPGSWLDDTATQCEATARWHTDPDEKAERCMLAAGHDGSEHEYTRAHRSEEFEWSTERPNGVIVPVGPAVVDVPAAGGVL